MWNQQLLNASSKPDKKSILLLKKKFTVLFKVYVQFKYPKKFLYFKQVLFKIKNKNNQGSFRNSPCISLGHWTVLNCYINLLSLFTFSFLKPGYSPDRGKLKKIRPSQNKWPSKKSRQLKWMDTSQKNKRPIHTWKKVFKITGH